MDKKDIDAINEMGTWVKAAYMLALLKPTANSNFIVFDEDVPESFMLDDKEIHFKKSHIVNKHDARIPNDFWKNLTAKYSYLTNEEYFKKIAVAYTTRMLCFLVSEIVPDFEPKSVIENELLINQILAPFDVKVYAELVFIDKMRNFLNENDVLKNYLKNKQEKKEAIEPSLIIMSYLLEKYQKELLNNWMFDGKTLKEILRILKISDDK